MKVSYPARVIAISQVRRLSTRRARIALVSLVLTGLLLLLAVMFVPQGFVVGLTKLARMQRRRRPAAQLSLQPRE